MKVIQINAIYGYGSTGLIVKDIGNLLISEGAKSGVAYQLCDVEPQNGYKVGSSLDWKIHGLLTRVCGYQAYFSKAATRKLIKWLDVQKPDIVHLHNLHANYINLNMLLEYLAKKNIATVITLHDCWFFTGKCFHFVTCGCDKWKKECHDCIQKKASVKSYFFDRSQKVFEDKRQRFQAISNVTVVPCSKWMASLAEQSPMFKRKRIQQIYNGVDTKTFHPYDTNAVMEKLGIKNSNFVVLGMANKWFNPRNREIVNSIVDDDRNTVMIVGCNEEQKQIFRQKSNVICIGFVKDRKELAQVYSAANVFVNLTFEDTLPTVNMESICCGTPVITYDSCGSPELVAEGKTGFVIEALNKEQLLMSLEQIRIGKIEKTICSEYGVSTFDKNIQYGKYLELYQSILTARAGK